MESVSAVDYEIPLDCESISVPWEATVDEEKATAEVTGGHAVDRCEEDSILHAGCSRVRSWIDGMSTWCTGRLDAYDH